MAKRKVTGTVAAKLRSAIESSGLSANQLSRDTGVAQTVISRFLRGEDMFLSRADILVAYMGGDISFPHRVASRVQKPK